MRFLLSENKYWASMDNFSYSRIYVNEKYYRQFDRLLEGGIWAISVPEQGGAGAISQDPLPPGTVYTASFDDEGKVGLYRLEVTLTAGTGKLRTPAGLERGLKESLNRAWAYLQSMSERQGLTATLAQNDAVAEAVEL